MTTSALERWREAQASLAVPESITGPQDGTPYLLEPERFRWKPEVDAAQPVRPSRRRALEALPEGGTVLDVGVGGGASSLGLAPRAAVIVGVDHHPGMLELFAASAREAGVEPVPVEGSWPEVAGEVGPVDVAVCHHAMYRVDDLAAFAAAMTERARHRVVVELSEHFPLSALNPLWASFHGLDRPDHPVADMAEAVFREMGLAVEREDLVLPGEAREVTPALVEFARDRLYVGPERDAEIEEFLRGLPAEDHRVTALWWPGAAPVT